MEHATQTQFGRLVEAVQDTEILTTDKWDALGALTDAAGHFDLSHRTLGVLKALMTFLPGRIINPEPGGAIVFPSNRTLSHRLNGMPDSTLRRHLAHLVRVGVVSRHDSPNRKRYARKVGQGIGIAFGFDLSPIARQYQMLVEAATRAREERQMLAALRTRIAHLRHMLLEDSGSSTLTEEVRIQLRRKPEGTVLHDLLARLSNEMSAPDSQNERHLEHDLKHTSDSEDISQISASKKTTYPNNGQDQAKNKSEPDIKRVLAICHEFKNYFKDPIRNWHDLVCIAERLTGMIGIDGPVFKQAIAAMGARRASTVVLCMLENMGMITNAGGYLRRLTQQASAGGFSEIPMLSAIANRQNCQLTT